MNNKARDLELKAKALRHKQRLAKLKNSNTAKVVEKKKATFIIMARARKPIVREDESLMSAIKWVITQIPVEDLYEIHDDQDRLLWGRSTKINPKVYKDEIHGS